MILLTVDDWIPLDGFSYYEIVTFKFILVVSPGETPPNMDDALFGMSEWEPFGRLRAGIGDYCGLDIADICLFWDSNNLLDEDTPDVVGMEASLEEKEELEIHIVSNNIEL